MRLLFALFLSLLAFGCSSKEGKPCPADGSCGDELRCEPVTNTCQSMASLLTVERGSPVMKIRGYASPKRTGNKPGKKTDDVLSLRRVCIPACVQRLMDSAKQPRMRIALRLWAVGHMDSAQRLMENAKLPKMRIALGLCSVMSMGTAQRLMGDVDPDHSSSPSSACILFSALDLLKRSVE